MLETEGTLTESLEFTSLELVVADSFLPLSASDI